MSDQVLILNFHGIGDPHPGVDEDERPYWIGEAQWEALLQMVVNHHGKERVIFTFDDGNKSDLTIAAPALKAYGCTGSFYVLAGRLQDEFYLTPEDLQSLVAMGMEIGLHGRSHVDWRGLDHDGLNDETIAAREEIARAAGAKVTSVGIPFGAYDTRVMRRLKAQSFEHIRTSDGGWTSKSSQVQGRTSVRIDTSLADIAALLEGRESPVRRFRRAVSTILRQRII